MPDHPQTTTPGGVSARAAAGPLARTMAAGTIGGALCGLVVGGVLGRLAMRLLALTSPRLAHGQLTDDHAIVGETSLLGTLALAAFTVQAGALGGLIYLLVRRVLPTSRRVRVAGFGLLAGAFGGAVFVHGYGSFDYTVLQPVWLSVALFVTLPLLFGLSVPVVVDALDGPGGWAQRGPWWLVAPAVIVGTVPVVLLLTAVGYAAALTISTVRPLSLWWRGRGVTILGSSVLLGLVLWGLYGLVVDIASIVTRQYPTAPFNP